MSDVTIYRNNLKTSPVKNGHISREDLFNHCNEKLIIGGGWGFPKGKEPKNYQDAINIAKEEFPKDTGCKKLINALSEMKENDLVWTRCGGNYYLCRVKSGWEYCSSEQANEFDMHQIAKVYDYVKIGAEDKIPTKVLNSFRSPLTLQKIDSDIICKLSKHLYNKNKKTNEYIYKDARNFEIGEETFFEFVHPKEMECLVALYLQKEKGYLLYSDTNRKSTPVYEYVLVKEDEDNHLAYVQVKTGDESLDATKTDYKELTKNKQDKVYLFTVDGSHYGEVEGKQNNIFFISKKEIVEFVYKYPRIIPEKIRDWLKK